MVKCSFSGEEIPPGTGVMYVRKDGKIFNFRNSKCFKNMFKLKRKAHKLKWTENYKKN